MKVWLCKVRQRFRRSGPPIIGLLILLLVSVGVAIAPALPRTATPIEWYACLGVVAGLVLMIFNLGTAQSNVRQFREDGMNGPRLLWARTNVAHEVIRIVGLFPLLPVLIASLAAPATVNDVTDELTHWALTVYRAGIIPALLWLIIGVASLSLYDYLVSWWLVVYTARHRRVSGRRAVIPRITKGE